MAADHPIPPPLTGSAVRSPPHDPNPAPSPPPSPAAENPTAAVPRATSIREEPAAAGSPARSPPRFAAENHTASPRDARALAIVLRASSIRDEAVDGSPARSPHRAVNSSPSRSGAPPPRYEMANSFKSVSSFPSPLRDAGNPTASPQYKESVFGSPVRGAMMVGSILRGPFADMAAEGPSLEEPTSPMVAVANHMVTRETTSTTKLGGRGGGGRGSTWVESGTSGQPPMRTAAFGLRILALILSLISFSVMAADKTSGWDGDSFDRYREFRYCLSVNVLVFVYSLFQIFVQIFWKIKKKLIMNRPVCYYFDLFMDQILAYFLMSASSAAASRNGDWVNDFGSDNFTKGINGSVAMSFLAFFALAFSSVISAYNFFSSIS